MWYINSDMITIFEVLTDPTRRRILDLLRMQPRLVGELVEILNMSQPAISKHLRVLREVGLVSVRQDAQRRWYELRPEPLMELDSWLKSYRYLWTERFERLDGYLQDLPKDPWGQPYQYLNDNEKLQIFSYGPKGKEGNSTIGNWNMNEEPQQT